MSDPFRLIHRRAARIIWDIARQIHTMTRAGAAAVTWIGRGWSPDSTEHATGRALDVIISPRVGVAANPAEARVGDLIADWLIRHADALHVRHIIWRCRIWRRRRRHEGWQPLPGRTSASSVSDRHDDHIHLYLDDDEGQVPQHAPLTLPPTRKETAMARTLTQEDIEAVVTELLLHKVTANGRVDHLVQHMADAFVADAAQSKALFDTNQRLSAIANQLAALGAALEKGARQ